MRLNSANRTSRHKVLTTSTFRVSHAKPGPDSTPAQRNDEPPSQPVTQQTACLSGRHGVHSNTSPSRRQCGKIDLGRSAEVERLSDARTARHGPSKSRTDLFTCTRAYSISNYTCLLNNAVGRCLLKVLANTASCVTGPSGPENLLRRRSSGWVHPNLTPDGHSNTVRLESAGTLRYTSHQEPKKSI